MRRVVGWVGLAAAGLVMTAALPASASGEITVSRDGVTWTRSLRGQLLDPDLRWNPGMSRTTEVHVRNGSAEDAVMSLVAEQEGAGPLTRSGDLQTSARLGDGPWFELPRSAADAAERRIAPHSQVRLQLRVALDARSTNQTQMDRLRLRFAVAAAEDVDQATAYASDADAGLPDTGSPSLGVWTLVGAVVLVATGRRLARGRAA